MPGFRAHVAARLDDLRRRSLLRDPVVSTAPTGTHVQVAGVRLLNLASNDYLGLAGDADLRAALADAARTWGGAGASRLISGSLTPHRHAEAALAQHVLQDDARLFSSGYAANLGALGALVGPGDVVFSDALNHASLIDGCRLSRARVVVFPHRDVAALERLLLEHRPPFAAALIATDAVFSMDGDLAPLPALRGLADRFDCGLLVDEAHALGILGPAGRGLAAHLTVRPDVTTGMLGKAFGLAGGFVAGAPEVIRLLESTARPYVYSTGVHPALAAVVPALVDRVQRADEERRRVERHRRVLAEAVRAAAPDIRATVPVLPVLLGAPERALEVSRALSARGVFAPAIRPPTVPVGTSRLRLVPIASHRDDDIAAAAAALREVLDAAAEPTRHAAAGRVP